MEWITGMGNSIMSVLLNNSLFRNFPCLLYKSTYLIGQGHLYIVWTSIAFFHFKIMLNINLIIRVISVILKLVRGHSPCDIREKFTYHLNYSPLTPSFRIFQNDFLYNVLYSLWMSSKWTPCIQNITLCIRAFQNNI